VPTGTGRGASGEVERLPARAGTRDSAGTTGAPAGATGSRRQAAYRERAPAPDRSGRMARIRELLALPFRISPRATSRRRAISSRARSAAPCRLARRERAAHRGRLDVRRTLRAATSTGGIPLQLRFRARRPAARTSSLSATCRDRSPRRASSCSVSSCRPRLLPARTSVRLRRPSLPRVDRARARGAGRAADPMPLGFGRVLEELSRSGRSSPDRRSSSCSATPATTGLPPAPPAACHPRPGRAHRLARAEPRRAGNTGQRARLYRRLRRGPRSPTSLLLYEPWRQVL